MSDIIKNMLDYLEDEETQDTPATEEGDTVVPAEDGETDTTNPDEVVLDKADEAAIFLAALEDSCTPEEYRKIVNEGAVELELYQLIESAAIATEAHRYVVTKTKQWDMNREEKKAALRLAAKADSPDYRQYVLHRQKMIMYRTKIFEKYGTRARAVAKQIVQNSRRKASSMNSQTGKSIVEKMDKKINEANKKNDAANKK